MRRIRPFGGVLLIPLLLSACSDDPTDSGDDAGDRPLGPVQWAAAISDGGDLVTIGATEILVHGDTVHLVGYTNQGVDFSNGNAIIGRGEIDGIWARFGRDGSFEGAMNFGGRGFDHGFDLDVAEDGSAALVGSFQENAAIATQPLQSEGEWDILVARFDAEAELVWARSFGGAGPDSGYEVQFGSNGEITLGAGFTGPIEIDGTQIAGSGDRDVLLLQLDSDGNAEWYQTATGTGDSYANGLVRDDMGDFYLGGIYQGAIELAAANFGSNGEWDSFIAAYTPTGAPRWAVHGTADGTFQLEGMTFVAPDHIVAVGQVAGLAYFGPVVSEATGSNSGFVWCLDTAGNTQWVTLLDGTDTVVYDVASAPSGELWITGGFSTSLEFRNSIDAVGFQDSFVARLAPDGTAGAVFGIGGEGLDRGMVIEVGPEGNVFGSGRFVGEARVFESELHTLSGDMGLYVFGQAFASE